jgi:hypothetical protein
MSRSALRLVLACLFSSLVIITLGAPCAQAQQDDALDSARKAFDEGQTLFDKGDFKAAAEQFTKAHEFKKFAAFLYNAAVCYEKLKDYQQAVDLFGQYLVEDPKAADRAAVETRVKALKAQLAAVAAHPEAPPPAAPVLPDAKPKGVVVIISKPDGATIFLDDKNSVPIGETPWNGSLEGPHKIIIELKGYKTAKFSVLPQANKIIEVQAGLSTEEYLGWLEVKSNIPGSDVYIDSKAIGAVGKTPWMGNVQPGKRKIWVVKEGYSEVEQTVTIVAGKPHNVAVTLEEAQVGFIRIGTNETGTGARVALDGKRVCDSAPCRFQAPVGEHEISVARGGRKTLNKNITVVRKTETNLAVNLAPEPGRFWDVFTPIIIGGAIIGGSVYWSTLEAGDENHNGKIDTNQEKLYKYGPIAGYGVGGLFLVYAVYQGFRDKGAASTGVIASHDLGLVQPATPATWLTPAFGPGYAGVAAGLTF